MSRFCCWHEISITCSINRRRIVSEFCIRGSSRSSYSIRSSCAICECWRIFFGFRKCLIARNVVDDFFFSLILYSTWTLNWASFKVGLLPMKLSPLNPSKKWVILHYWSFYFIYSLLLFVLSILKNKFVITWKTNFHRDSFASPSPHPTKCRNWYVYEK